MTASKTLRNRSRSISKENRYFSIHILARLICIKSNFKFDSIVDNYLKFFVTKETERLPDMKPL
jgi:hypothetical protein